jgi:hypothetical protein
MLEPEQRRPVGCCVVLLQWQGSLLLSSSLIDGSVSRVVN